MVTSAVTSAMHYITSVVSPSTVSRKAIEDQVATSLQPLVETGPPKSRKKKKSKGSKNLPTAFEGGASLPLAVSSSTNSQTQEYPAAVAVAVAVAPVVDPEEGGWTVVESRGKVAHRAGSAGTPASLSLQSLDIDLNHKIQYDDQEFKNVVLPQSFGAFKTAFSADHGKLRDHDQGTIEKWMQIANKIRGHGTGENRSSLVKENKIAKAVYSDLIHYMKSKPQNNPQIGWAYLGLAKVESSLLNQNTNTIEKKVRSCIDNALKSNPAAPLRAACHVFLGDILKRNEKFEESYQQYCLAYESGVSGNIRGEAALGKALFLHKEAERQRKVNGQEMAFEQFQKTGNLFKEGIEHLGQDTSANYNDLLQSSRKQMLYSVGALAYKLEGKYPNTDITPFLDLAEFSWGESQHLHQDGDDHARQVFATQVYTRLGACIESASLRGDGDALKRMVPFASSLDKRGLILYNNSTNRRRMIIVREAGKLGNPPREGERFSVERLGRFAGPGREGGTGGASKRMR